MIVVIGAGAAGLMAALFAARAGREVALLESTGDGGKKILISGGGRCNILPSRHEPERFVTASSKHSLKNILRSWPLKEQRTFFENELDQPLLLEEETGKLFPSSNRALDVRDELVRTVKEAGAKFWTGSRAMGISSPDIQDDHWRVKLENGRILDAEQVVLATGGLSVPQTGSDGRGLAIATKLGHTVNTTYPALTPLLSGTPAHARLAGVSLTVTINSPITKSKFSTTGGFLFTHRGYSGPAVLDASHVYTRAEALTENPATLFVQWTEMDQRGWDDTLLSSRGTVLSLLSHHLPRRLAEQLISECKVAPQQGLSQLTKAQRRVVTKMLTQYPLCVSGNEGYRKAEVTGGGVALGEINPRTMESRVHSGLFFCGEILDAFGPIGGYNFQWAWATGKAAGIGAGLALAHGRP